MPTPESGGAAREPLRTCVGCRVAAPKRTLLRIAATSDGRLRLDHRDRMPGRGAYVHAEPACVDRALAKGANAVRRALRAGSDPDAAARLRRDIEGELQA